ncbi:MAG TPA: hypothetical protein VGQ05_14925 [Streptosporangiaceae bacterium]|jgi:hypothetical protein|nr:hypothetical protein [Streptosporangiaceae bacterium]
MSRPRLARPAGLAGLAALALLTTACGGSSAVPSQAAAPPPAPRPSMLTSLSAGHGAAWAVVEVGGSRAEHNNFWQLLVRPAAGQAWRLATPPGVADNGGLVATGPGSTGSTAGPGSTGNGSGAAGSGASTAPGLVAGFVPSQDLTFSPLAVSRDGGQHWSPGLLPSGLAATASALAAGPGGRLLALTRTGVQLSGSDGAGWSPLISTKALAASPAGRSCGLTGLTAVAFGSGGAPLLAGACRRPGVTGIFFQSGGQWRLAGLKPPAGFAGRPVTVVQLTSTAPGKLTALLADGPAPAGTGASAGTGPGTARELAAAWLGDGQPWTTSAPLPLGGAQLVSTAAGSDGSAGVILTGGRAAVIRPAGATTAAAWAPLPALPAAAADLVLGPGHQVSVLTAGRTTVTTWLLGKTGTAWSPGQKLTIPVPFGSSG